MDATGIQAVLSIVALLGAGCFNLAFWYYKLRDIEERLTVSSKRIGSVDDRLNRLINIGNRRLGWDFEWYENGRER